MLPNSRERMISTQSLQQGGSTISPVGKAATCTYQFPEPMIASFSLPIVFEAAAVAENDLAWYEAIRGDTGHDRNDLGEKAEWGVGLRRERSDVNVLVGMMGSGSNTLWGGGWERARIW